MSEQTCTSSGSMLRRGCGRPAVTACVYCGEPFCEAHGERAADFQDVCNRRACQAKLRDLEVHLVWRREVIRFNQVSICANEECAQRMRHACSQCRLLFCEIHVNEHDVLDTRVRPTRKMRALVCFHCLERRRIWE